jgi:CO/xanthine dehydrogenase FAD-binding subunit
VTCCLLEMEGEIRGDFRASGEYRRYLLERMLDAGLDELSGEGSG